MGVEKTFVALSSTTRSLWLTAVVSVLVTCAGVLAALVTNTVPLSKCFALSSSSSAAAASSLRCATLWEQKLDKHAHLSQLRAAAIADAATGGGGGGTRFTRKEAYDPFEPTYTCHSEYRRGKLLGDGGKFVCGDAVGYFRSSRRGSGGGGGGGGLVFGGNGGNADTTNNSNAEPCLVYSVGSNGDASFELDITKSFGCEVHTFDPTGNTTLFRARVEAAGAHFHAIGVSGAASTMPNTVTGATVQLLPIHEIIASLGHSRRPLSILKIDCEGCEYAAFATLWPYVESGAVSIGQIQIELHGTDFATISAFFEGAHRAGFMVFHKERNQWGCDGYTCVEFSLIHIEEAKRIFESQHCQ